MSEIALQLIAENKGTKNLSLDLGKCGLTEVPKELFDCVWLEELILSDEWWDERTKKMVESLNSGTNNYLSEIPAEIGKLQNLKSLKMGGRRQKIQTSLISDISFLQPLIGLQFLDLSSNGISNAGFLQHLKELKYLSLRCNDISNTSFLQSLKKLQYLILSKNHISKFSSLQSLTDLEYLDLSKNQISDIGFLQPLKNLKHLSLRSNPILNFSFLQKLTSLQSLNLGNQRIPNCNFIKFMLGLKSLDLHNCQISDVHFLSSLTGLRSLDLRTNQISDITPLIGLFLQKAHNPLKIVFKESYTINEEEINLFNNPLSTPPMEFVQQGNDAILYWFQAQDQGKVVNREAKIILFGNGNSGKTTLSHRLRNNEFVQLTENDRTHGILIETWNIPQKDFPIKLQQKIDESIQQHDMTSPLSISSPDSLKVHLWDFGGQEYYHATHRLFMSSNILYLLLWESSTNHQDEKGDYPVAYWQKSISYFSPQNITLCVQNKVDRQSDRNDDLHYKIAFRKEIDESGLTQYDRDIKDLKEGILEQLTKLPYVGALFPKVYDDIRQALRKETKPFISYGEYKNICNEVDSTAIKIMQDDGQKETLIRFLDDTGAVVCFRFRKGIETAELKEYVFTSPNWLTQIIYEILEREVSEFDLQHVETVIANQEYRMDAKVWIEIMKQFELIFEIEKKDGIKYVVPQYLPLQCTNQEGFDLAIENKKMQPSFTIKYPEFLPKSNFLRLIAQYGKQNIKYLYWKSGLLFSLNEKTIIAECISNEQERKIIISVQDKDVATTKKIFESLIAIDESEDLQVSMNEKDFVLFKKLKDKISNNNTEIETTDGNTLPVAGFYTLFGKKEKEPQKNFVEEESVNKHEIFFSYAWGEGREDIVNKLYESLEKDAEYKLTRDKNVLQYRDLISEFMKRLGRGDFIIVAISDKYLRSENCMFELYEIYRNSKLETEELKKKIFPVFVEDISLDKPANQKKYVQHWQIVENEWDDLKNNSNNFSDKQNQKLIKTKKINAELGELMMLLSDMDMLNREILSANNFEKIKNAIKDRAKEL